MAGRPGHAAWSKYLKYIILFRWPRNYTFWWRLPGILFRNGSSSIKFSRPKSKETTGKKRQMFDHDRHPGSRHVVSIRITDFLNRTKSERLRTVGMDREEIIDSG